MGSMSSYNDDIRTSIDAGYGCDSPHDRKVGFATQQSGYEDMTSPYVRGPYVKTFSSKHSELSPYAYR